LVAAGVSPQARGESLTVEEFARIAEHGRQAPHLERQGPERPSAEQQPE
ncbi:16S rRNA (adenine(1518)-N(6)/adenine(1519)-N(6))-dimethyltransferase, partial [Streptomyces sp. SID625]|nr:16S rRNA (adenine(1518)-N(6)/adenine(1519)-N(6))-dimethyltransferase [Streptomyces sp. SID625]